MDMIGVLVNEGDQITYDQQTYTVNSTGFGLKSWKHAVHVKTGRTLQSLYTEHRVNTGVATKAELYEEVARLKTLAQNRFMDQIFHDYAVSCHMLLNS
tara:strand:- start:843 stop:1136 length:294 start_codon:yes stop_codon:yes gene_type:complete